MIQEHVQHTSWHDGAVLYPMVWDNSDVRFLDRTDSKSRTRKEVRSAGSVYILIIR
jgi:hypothetical protein